jgi:hypothetical protein
LTVATASGGSGALFVNIPPRGFVHVLKPDGTLVRALPTGDELTRSWDLLTDAGSPIAGGLYRALVQGRDASGRPVAPQLFYFGVVRKRAE